MKRTTRARELVKAHYDAAVDDWMKQYDSGRLNDPLAEYPANQFRLKLLLRSVKKNKIKSVFEIGFGAGIPLVELSKRGMDVHGIDIAPRMVERAKINFKRAGLDPERLFWGDIHEPSTYEKHLLGKRFDGLLAMGVMPHIEHEEKVIENMVRLVKPGGTVFIEFRNSLFSLFTQNRYTKQFMLDELLKNVSPKLRSIVEKDLNEHLRMDQPPVRRTAPDSKKGPGYDLILSKFHNPFEVVPMFERLGFKDIKLLWYHYHPAMPYLQKKDPKLFLKEAITLEGEDSGWRGYFLCSAFVVEARK